MRPFRAVEALDVVEHVSPSFVARAIGFARRALGLQRREKLSMAALSQQLPERLMEQVTP